MIFISTLIALIIERFFHWSQLRHWNWFPKYQRMLIGRISNWPSYALLTICALPLLIIVGVVNHLLGFWFHGVLKIIFDIVVLLYCMGPDNLWLQTFACLGELNKEDPKYVVERAQSTFNVPPVESSQAFHQALTGAIFAAANQRVFAVVFWFVILGPVGAVLYRVITLCAVQSDFGLTQVAKQAQQILDWVPARLFTFLFALGGHFVEVFNIWKADAKTGLDGNDKLLTECGVAAIDVKDSNQLPEDGSAEKSALELLDRVFVMWLVILAVITLAAK